MPRADPPNDNTGGGGDGQEHAYNWPLEFKKETKPLGLFLNL